ncbi:hypothetical protein CNEO4_1770008 [Clostridium neonatale]|uniref:Uncharacterized protein n=1 Tax=Clostridium neonatale TaxID=137838 RepID=A0AA86MH33_9CLOT|nr:hypothetical protein CNEO_10255 [Clostridium neonatale]CAG9711871.1 hypothetical protein CNEO_1570008 [Clostridium neonatale]CAI3195467.1 hypothetical protein CNEO2_150019 [Clostridium neonatale]CAI3200013.1 hypothetical protein CNEO2_200071 [Clostridium neonatale]CAI3215038.1 hypothetical protein CNEO2_770008 [Clostridium neonatale]
MKENNKPQYAYLNLYIYVAIICAHKSCYIRLNLMYLISFNIYTQSNFKLFYDTILY